jgi:hypothetical protein
MLPVRVTGNEPGVTWEDEDLIWQRNSTADEGIKRKTEFNHRWTQMNTDGKGRGKLKPRIDTNENEFERAGEDAKWGVERERQLTAGY